MASYRIEIKRSAEKDLENLPNRKDRRRVVARIRQLADDPRPAGSQKLADAELFRVRQGNHRIVYSVEDEARVVMVVRVRHRRDVYR